jgi:hypothetical protein
MIWKRIVPFQELRNPPPPQKRKKNIKAIKEEMKNHARGKHVYYEFEYTRAHLS